MLGRPGDHGARVQDLVEVEHRHVQGHAATLFQGTVEPAAGVQVLRIAYAVLTIVQVCRCTLHFIYTLHFINHQFSI